MEDELDLKIHRVLKLHGYRFNKMSEDSVIGFISFIYSPITQSDYELYTAIQKLVVYLYKLKVPNTQFSVEKHEIEPEVRQFMIDSLTERILNMLTPHGENYEYLKSWVSKRIDESVFGKWKYYVEYYAIFDDIVESMLDYIENHYKKLIFTIEQLPKLFLQPVFNEAYEYCMPQISVKYQYLAGKKLTLLDNNDYKILEKVEDIQRLGLKDSDVKSAVISSIQHKSGMRVFANDKGGWLIQLPKTKKKEEKLGHMHKPVFAH